MADQAMLSSLVLSHSADGRRLCKQNRLACVGPAKEEVALALIGARHTKLSRQALLRLLAYNLDGSVGEDYNCYVLNTGRAIKADLLSVVPEQLSSSCHEKVDKMVAELKQAFPDFESQGVCSTPDQVRSKIKQFSRAIDKGARCGSGDF
jgi:hypothetical protein